MKKQTYSYSRMASLVPSTSRKGAVHVVDFEGTPEVPVMCTCESFILGGNARCRHISGATIPML